MWIGLTEAGEKQESQIVKAKIHVTFKQGILDPQGKAIEHALDSLGFKNAARTSVSASIWSWISGDRQGEGRG